MGWRDEPALAGLPNAVALEVRDKTPNAGIEGLEKTLTIAVSIGGSTDALRPEVRRGGVAGVYAADIIPTRAGDYIFRLQGKIADQSVDERFESGPGRFDPVARAGSISYPDQTDPREELAALSQDLVRLQLMIIGVLVVAVVGSATAISLSRRARRP